VLFSALARTYVDANTVCGAIVLMLHLLTCPLLFIYSSCRVKRLETHRLEKTGFPQNVGVNNIKTRVRAFVVGSLLYKPSNPHRFPRWLSNHIQLKLL
jgi:hypothetical protein